ncbi:hypothetical protein HYH02_011348 [Chlamydomonas schloesseri]|uniref:RING-type domain-containing protein n=1 Tax=Chlamydomonas schloesseri TaxID=2026947 RepID=A0A835TB30_9CHLO|nr:hypothetical protein HYH02_011348 [Chlamydomonas schloesseri]|eukprot:KAG2437089.1 hypothetical protein HYH02_011348 [Chlamydomonas schloesseri]
MEVYDQEHHFPAVLRCGHHAGEPCMREWLRTQRKCPTCRTNAKPGHMARLYNLPTVAAAVGGNGGGAAAPSAAAAAPQVAQSQLAEREIMLQAAQRAKAKAEEDARRAQQVAQEREAEAKRYKLHAEALLAELAAKERRHQAELAERERSTRQALAAAAAAAAPAVQVQPAPAGALPPPPHLHGLGQGQPMQQQQQLPYAHLHHGQHQHHRAWHQAQQPQRGPQPSHQPHHLGAPGPLITGGWPQPGSAAGSALHSAGPASANGAAPGGAHMLGGHGARGASSSTASSASASTHVSGVLAPPPPPPTAAAPPGGPGPRSGAAPHDANGPLPASWTSGPKSAPGAGQLGCVPGMPPGYAPPPGAMWGHFQPQGSGTPPPPLSAATQAHGAAASQLDGTRGAADTGASGRFAPSPYPSSHAPLHHGPGATQHPQPCTPYQAGAGSAAAAGVAGPGGAGGRPALFERVFAVPTEGCRFVAVDAEQGRLLATESSSGGGGSSTCIRKISLVSPESSTRIRLPANAGLVTDLQLPPPSARSGGGAVAPAAQRLVAVVSRGAGLCLACPRADSVVATFSGLPAKAMSCSWVGSSSSSSSSGSSGGSSAGGSGHLLLAGLERGSLALLDVRRPDRPVAVMAVLANTQRCAQMPVRTVAALPTALAAAAALLPVSPAGLAVQGKAAAAGSAAATSLWPACAISCPRGAWLMVPTEAAAAGGAADGGSSGGVSSGTEAAAAGGGSGTALLQLDGGFGAGGNLQIESLAVHWHQGEEQAAAAGSGDGASCRSGGSTWGSWRAALSWRPADVAAGPMTAGPRHEIGRINATGPVPFMHEVTVSDYTRIGHQAVRSCMVPAAGGSMFGGGEAAAAAEQPGLLLASSDDRTCTPLIWSLGCGSGPGAAAAAAGGPVLLQSLEPHPSAVNCLAAGGAVGGSTTCFLACGSESRVTVYRRRCE